MDQKAPVNVSAPVSIPADDRISAKEVAAITGMNPKRVREAAALGHLTVWKPPAGMRGAALYSRRSAENLARSLVTPAHSTQSCPSEVLHDG